MVPRVGFNNDFYAETRRPKPCDCDWSVAVARLAVIQKTNSSIMLPRYHELVLTDGDTEKFGRT